MLEIDGLNYWAVLVVWLINIMVGAFWYSPAAFGKEWKKHTGVDMMKIPKEKANKIISFVAVSGLVQAVVLAIVVNSLGATTAIDGLVAGVLLCAGFTAATTVGVTLYSMRSWRFWWINSSYFFLVMAVNSVILAIWQ